MRVILLLLLLSVTSSYQECNTPIIRDIIQGGSGESAFLSSLLGETGLPLINGPYSVESLHGSNPVNTPVFKLNTSYYITAVDIQFGSTTGGFGCNQNVIVEGMDVIRIGDNEPPTNPIQIGYTNSNDQINLLELGNPNNDRIIRLKFNPTLGRSVKYVVSITNLNGLSCLRTEIYGCVSAPPTDSTLLQYNLIQPTQYADSLYTGVTSEGYLSGGEGLLNDGVIGMSPITNSAQWLGWSNPSLESPEILLLFSYKVSISTISLFYGGVSGTVSISSETGAVSESSQVTQVYGGVSRVIYSYAGLTAGLLKIDFTGSDSVLLTEIQVLSPGGESLLGNVLDTSKFSGITPVITTTSITPTMGVTGGTDYNTPSVIVTTITTTTTATNNPLPIGLTTESWISIALAIILLISVITNITLITIFCLYCCRKLRRSNTDNSYVDMKPAARHDYDTVDRVTDSQYHTL